MTFNGQLTRALLCACLLVAFAPAPAHARQAAQGSIEGAVTDAAGAAVAGARVYLIDPHQVLLKTTRTDGEGRFRFEGVQTGSYVVRVAMKSFAGRRVTAQVGASGATTVAVTLEAETLNEHVTVTAETGQALDPSRVAQRVNVIPEDGILMRAKAVLAQVGREEPGLELQRTSPTMGAIFVRGLTGKNVSTYVDGVRYTTSAQRGGVNTFFNLNEPTSLRAVEVLRGPNSAQYGSDSLGGTVALVSQTPGFGFDRPETHGEATTFFNSADLSFGGNTLVTYGSKRVGLLMNLAARRANTLRPGGGYDSHSSVNRFLGLRSDILGERLTDTAFTQYGGTFHINYAPTNDQQLVFHYQRAQQDGGKRYDQTLGGDGNLISDLRNLMLDFFYGRYVKHGVGFFDTGSLTFSFNSQREERVNQGGRGNPFGNVTFQYERTNVYGLSFNLDKRFSSRNTLLFGGDLYHERVNAPAHTLNPVTNVDAPSRGRAPDEARYVQSGLFVQDFYEAVPGRVRLSGALRYNVASYRSRAADSPTIGGARLWPDDSLYVDDFSGRAGIVVTAADNLNLAFNYSRGFRAPNITDLGTLGLTGDGFEIDTATAAALGGTVGTTAGRAAVSTGRPVVRQQSEVSNNFDASVLYRRGRWRAEATGFLIDINKAITKQALILPAGSTGRLLGDQPITSQLSNGVVFVPLSAAPVLVRANFSDARLYGTELGFDAPLARDFAASGGFTYIYAKDKETGLPPNIEGGTPAPNGFLRLRYEPAGGSFWVEAYGVAFDRQTRLSSLDLGDRRTGATRSRDDIRDFFRRGACVRGLVAPGPDGRCATGDETILIPTGETLAQVQNRLLGSATSAPLFVAVPGYGLVGIRGGLKLGENSDLQFEFDNLADKNYRGISWGIDGPGRSFFSRYRLRF
ncbi:MAG TPA: TonB-dependent receptor [Pyrinomonadaceae bacterium]|nr:TonB-dependent receptor [Pyrinomonadaceae bacterium]